MGSLYDAVLPILQGTNTEGGNMQAHLVRKQILDEIDRRTPSNASYQAVSRKILNAAKAHKGDHDHERFSQVVEAFGEGLVLLAADERSLTIRAVPDGSKQGKTPDFETTTSPVVGLELKTLNVVDPKRTMEGAMEKGFEASYEAEQKAKSEAAKSQSGVGIGFGIAEFAPHGTGVGELGAIVQTIGKINSAIKFGQYAARPTILVVSIFRLGVRSSPSELWSFLSGEDGSLSGHLFAIGAGKIGDAIWGYDSKGFAGSAELGPLPVNGVLRDHNYVAGIAFVEMSGQDYSSLRGTLRRSVRVHGIWNNEWERTTGASQAEKDEAKVVFDRLCDFWNDVDDTREQAILDVPFLRQRLYLHVHQYMHANVGSPASGPAFEQFMIEADRLYHAWRCAEQRLDFGEVYSPITGQDIAAGLDVTKRPAIVVTAPPIDPVIHRLELLKTPAGWQQSDDVNAVTAVAIDL